MTSSVEITNLRHKSIRSAVWMSGLQGLVGLLYFGVPLVLSYLVTPAEMGVLELVVVVFALSTMVVELGAAQAVVQRIDPTPRYLATVFWTNLALAALLAALLYVTAPAFDHFMRADAVLIPMLRALGPCLILHSIGVVPRGLLSRRMEFKRLTSASVIGIVPAVAAAGTALRFMGVFGILYGILTLTTLTSAAMWLAAGYRPAWTIDRTEVAPTLRFGSSTTLGTAAEMLSVLFERVLMARFLGTASVGLWGLTRSLAREPLRRVMAVFDEVLLPGLASLQNDLERSRRYYLTVVRYELAIFGPVVIFTAVFAYELTTLFYGDAWLPVSLVAQLLVLQTWRTITVHSVGAIFLARGRPDVRVRWVALSIGATPVYFFAGYRWGLPGYAAACSVLGWITWALSHQMANHVLELDWKRFARALSRPVLAHAIFALLLIGARLALLGTIAVHGSDTVLSVIVPALLAYTAILAACDRSLLVGVVTSARDAFRRAPGAGADDESRTRRSEAAC
jgi:O-antigen/teichoic acid export membrane protein